MSKHTMIFNFPFSKQLDRMDCGPTCLRMIARHYGKSYPIQYLREKCFITREGSSLLGISDAAESIGFRTLSIKVNYEKLDDDVPLPCIVHWNQNHFVVVYKINRNKVYVADPAHGLLKYKKEEFLKSWLSVESNGRQEGVALVLEPSPDFYHADEGVTQDRTKMSFLLTYLKPYKKFFVQIFLSMLIGSLLGLIFPFLTQAIVDFGINNQNIGFVYTILIAQLMLFTGRTAVEFIRSWIFLHIGTRINVTIISDFLIKLMKLPMPFFDTKMIGDLLQRIGDHTRIQQFLTSTTINSLFAIINLLIFGLVLALYSSYIFGVFFIASVLSTSWILVFMKKRKEIDYKRFNQLSQNQSQLIQLITGMQEIKLNGAEKQKRWNWENVQAKLFKISVSSLTLDQTQQAGMLFINETKNIFISFLAAKEVIDGNMTLGMMMAVQYIIGQLNAPIGQLIGFVQTAQDAKISLERMGEIHNKKNEEDPETAGLNALPTARTISVNNLSFQYEGPHSEFVLKDISLAVPEGKVTAIVGTSGSGKTTLMKLFLKFYEPVQGNIFLGGIDLQKISARLWRQKCGVVIQDGFIFSDTIANNIALGHERIDRQRVEEAAHIANIDDFIETLPLGYNTKIGSEGHGLSQGQRQRILIARAVYKNPEFIFFDEATSALDANNERTIIDNLQKFFQGKTVVVIAHRLSTVKNADQIIVLEKGRLIESGSHSELADIRGAYFHLVKNQLELGS